MLAYWPRVVTSSSRRSFWVMTQQAQTTGDRHPLLCSFTIPPVGRSDESPAPEQPRAPFKMGAVCRLQFTDDDAVVFGRALAAGAPLRAATEGSVSLAKRPAEARSKRGSARRRADTARQACPGMSSRHKA